MSLISNTGDFFRGAFGESAEEKRQRKLREAQQSAARKQQENQAKAAQKTLQQTQQQKAQTIVKANPTKAPVIPMKPKAAKDPTKVASQADLIRALQGNKNKALNANPALRGQLADQANLKQPGKINYVLPAAKDAVIEIARDWVTRPVAEVAQTARDVTNRGNGAVYTPGSRVEKAIFGEREVQSIQEKTKRQYERDTKNETGYRKTFAKPLAAGEVIGSIINDAPVIGAAAKATGKTAKLTKDGVKAIGKLFGKKAGKEAKALADTLPADEDAVLAANATQKAIQDAENVGKVDEVAIQEVDSTPAYQRKQAADDAKAKAEAEGNPKESQDRPTAAHQEDIRQIIRTADQKFNDYVLKHPKLTAAEVDTVRNAAKKRAEELIAKLQDARGASIKAVEDQRTAEQAMVDAQQTAVGEAQTAAAAKTNPNPADVVQDVPATPNPELQTNNAYADESTNVLKAVGTDTGEVKRGNILYRNPIAKAIFGAQQKYVEGVDALRASGATVAQDAIRSTNGATRGATELGRAFFKNFGQSDIVRNALIKRTSHVQNAGRVAAHALDTIEKEVKAIGNPSKVYERIYRVLEDPAFLERVYGDGTKLSIDDLSPAERAVFDKLVELNKVRNRINLQTGVITKEQYFAYADGMHSPRIYDINVEHPELKDFVSSPRYKDLKAGIQRKDIADIPDYILSQLVESPFQASALRLETALKNLANDEALGNLDAAGGLVSKAPNDNFVPLEGKKYGKYEGKYIDKQILSQIDGRDYYNSNVGQKIGDAIDAFHNSILGAPGRFYKQARTVFSPGTIVGNFGSGQLAFSGAVNINPVTSIARTFQATKQLAAKGINPQVQEAELNGLFAGNTGRQITHSKEAESAIRGGKNGPVGKVKDFYGGIDKATALGWYNELRARGLTPEQAVSRVHLGMQNYDNAGRVINALSDAPVLGKPFARFTPELLRILKNNVLYNPVGTMAKVGLGAAGSNYLVNQAGETPEERAARENAVGQTKIGNQSLNIPIPDKIDAFGKEINLPGHGSAVNIARAIGLNFPQEPNGNPNTAVIRQLNPLADPTRTNAQGEQELAPNQLVSDMAYRQIADQLANRDFMGRQITDPNNKTYYENGDASVRKYSDTLTDNEKNMNRLKALVMGAPGAPEINSLYSGIKHQADFYGKTRTPWQAALRTLGLKTEDNSPAAQKKRVESKQYFDEELPAIQSFVRENPDLADTYYKLRNPERNRNTNTKTSDLISPEKWKMIHADTSGRLFNFIKGQAMAQSAKDSTKPIDPLYQLPDDQAKYVLELRSRPTGDDVEAQDILRATSNWYKNYEDRYHNYLGQNEKWFESRPKLEGQAKESPRVSAYSEVSPPVEQPPIIAEYMRIKAADPDKAKEVYKANKDALSTAFDAYAIQKLDRINKLRKIEGYEPISLEVYKNKTFGFDIDGGGFGGGGGGSKGTTNLLGDLSNMTGTINRLDPIEAQALPNLVALFQKLQAGAGGGRSKPTIGASARGQ